MIKLVGSIIIIVTSLIFRTAACQRIKDQETEQTNQMVKLYKHIDNQLYYWESWDNDDNSATVHWGTVGQRGQNKKVKSGLFSDFRKAVQKEISKKINEGYSEFEDDKASFLEIEYAVNGFGTEHDLDKRHRLEERMDEVLGWTGLGHCDGGSIGSGTMEVGCIVVDFELAKKVIVEDLEGTEFENYTRIYKMNE